MKPYGVDRKDAGCCPGHDKFPAETYSTSRSKHAQTRDTKIAHQRARARIRQEINYRYSHVRCCDFQESDDLV